MGVKDLWTVLEPIGSECSLKDLKELTLAVDTSLWVYQGQVDGKCLHLRNMFWRVHGMIRNQIRPVFVTEGPSHPLKWETRGQSSHQTVDGHMSSFDRQTQKCCQLLKALGVPVIASAGEGEATCAALNVQGMVNGVITEDSDAFLFGATVVYRHFSCNDKKMKRYTMEEIKQQLNLDRRKLVAYALLAGCDFTKGVPSVGKAAAVKLLDSLGGERDILERFQSWRDDDVLQSLETHRSVKKPEHCRICTHAGSRKSHKSDGCGQCNLQDSCTKASSVICCCDWHQKNVAFEKHRCELNVRTKAMDTPDFPDQRIIDAFLTPSELQKLTNEDTKLEWHHPNLAAIKEVLHWSSAEAKKYIQAVLEMVTAYDMAEILGTSDAAKDRIQPDCILKMKVEKGMKKVVVKWQFVADITEMTGDLTTTEDYALFERCFSSCLQTFLAEDETKSKAKAVQGRLKRKRKCKELADSKQQKGQSSITDHFKIAKKDN